MRQRARIVVAAAGSAWLVGLSACGGSSSESSGASSNAGEPVVVQVLDNSFRPTEIQITAGTEVIFENRGRNDHNILPDSVAGDADLTALLASSSAPEAWGVASSTFLPGTEFRHVFTTPGRYTFYCSIHGAPGAGMYGAVDVS